MPQQQLNFGNFTYVGMGNGGDGKHFRQAELQHEFYGVDTNYPGSVRMGDEALTPFWPARGGMLGESQPMLVAPPDHSPLDQATGGNANLGFNGVTRDVNNTPVGGATVRLFRSLDGSLIHQVTSKADGAYDVSTPYAGEGHFLVCHKTGPPDIAGASVATLEPT